MKSNDGEDSHRANHFGNQNGCNVSVPLWSVSSAHPSFQTSKGVGGGGWTANKEDVVEECIDRNKKRE